MTDYRAPLDDIRFVLREVVDFPSIARLPGYEEASPDLVDAVLEEAARLAQDEIGPLNRTGDVQGARLENGQVLTPDGFREAYARFVEGGWNGLPVDAERGGQGLPWVLNAAVTEMWDAACTAWSLCPMLTVGAIEALEAHGSEDLRRTYLPKLVTGEWTGTMNLTEPQAGSDVGALRTRARRDGDRWRLQGQKIFITYGDQDYTDNIVHMVLARTEGAPEGVKGISLFLVPKFLPNADGTPGARNDLRPVSLEHKMGIHGSPTCVMAYGENEGAIGWLVGEECEGMACMFTMMNNARLNVGLLGLGTGERAYQQAVAFAKERVQGRDMASGEQGVPIVRHPDVRRMLMLMKAGTEAARALLYHVAARLDRAKRHPDAETRRREQAAVDLLIPVAKAWCTDIGCEVAHLGVQVHGGMGFIEETGAAQHMRDARIHPIYEGTNGIQANDLLGRKLLRDGGAAAAEFIEEMRATVGLLAERDDVHLAAIRSALDRSIDCLETAVDRALAVGRSDPRQAHAGAVPLLTLFGETTGGWLMARSALAAQRALASAEGAAAFHDAKLKTARFYADQVLSRAPAHAAVVCDGGEMVMALTEDQF